MTENLDAVVAGHICLDIYPGFGHIAPGKLFDILQPGRLVEIGEAMFSTGGAVSNTGLALHKLGMLTRLVGKIGRDYFGEAVLDIIRSHGEDLTGMMRVDEDSHTSYTFIINSPGVDRILLNYPGANGTFNSADVPAGLLSETRLFHFGYPPIMQRFYENGGAELALMYRLAKEAGATTSLDISLPDPASPSGRVDWREIYKRTLPYVDIFLPNIEELMVTLRPGQYHQINEKAGVNGFLSLVDPAMLDDISAELLDMGVKIAGIKLGAKGIYLRTAAAGALKQMGRAAPASLAAWADKRLWAPCFKVKVAGTTGAGDSTNAGFLAALLRGLGPGETVTMGVAVGACNVEAIDALSGICGWDAALARISSGWEQHALDLKSYGWREDPSRHYWIGE
jgi:sugar/nucleoside kinase (ribokinase family)